MATEIKYHWRFFDKSGKVVAEGMSPRESDDGDFHLNDDGYFENKKTGELKNGDIITKYYDNDGNEVENPADTKTITRDKSDNSRAFGEIRSNLSSGVVPVFEKAVRTDRSKIEEPQKPQPNDPIPPNNGEGAGRSLVSELSRQNDILRSLVSKVSQKSGLNKISRSLDSFEKAFKSSIEGLSKEVSKGFAISAHNSGDSKVAGAIGSLKTSLDKIATVKDDLAKISENGKGLLDIEKDRHAYEKTPQAIKDLDGETVANLSPRDAQTANNATQAKKNTDINNFELLDSDIEDLFGDLPDITGLFNVPYSSSVDSQYTK
ncbi:hypothetical protein [Campylobacter showae]|uniref:Uncharacterized protein n=1 Tax=Campylobacter showae CC57C TaxID=1073353 RepID=M3GWB7_9BACT|nr:hypothetical protein [Campylobacter showae]EMG29740.1 hypothetical protein H740_10122 [Campylobacter showae CC57C]